MDLSPDLSEWARWLKGAVRTARIAASARCDAIDCGKYVSEEICVGSFFSTFWTDFVDRFDGPLHFRLFVQPLMAILFAVRDGRRDAREGRGAYLWKFINRPEHRRQLIESGLKSIFKVFVLAFVVYQFVEWHGLKPLQALSTATVLAVIPYVLLRGPINRVMQIRRTRRSVV